MLRIPMLIYKSFSELLAGWSRCSAPALIFGDPISSISYSELAALIRQEAEKIRNEKTVRRKTHRGAMTNTPCRDGQRSVLRWTTHRGAFAATPKGKKKHLLK